MFVKIQCYWGGHTVEKIILYEETVAVFETTTHLSVQFNGMKKVVSDGMDTIPQRILQREKNSPFSKICF